MSDQQELFRRLVNEEEEAFKEVYKLAYRPAASYVRAHGGDNDEIQDVFQEGMIGLVQLLRKPGFVATASVTSLMYAICRNQWGHACRKRGKEIPFEEFPPNIQQVELPDLEEREREHSETNNKVSAALEEMTEPCHTLILMKFYQDKSGAEMGAFLNVEEGAARVRLFRCMNKLRAILSKKYHLDL